MSAGMKKSSAGQPKIAESARENMPAANEAARQEKNMPHGSSRQYTEYYRAESSEPATAAAAPRENMRAKPAAPAAQKMQRRAKQ